MKLIFEYDEQTSKHVPDVNNNNNNNNNNVFLMFPIWGVSRLGVQMLTTCYRR